MMHKAQQIAINLREDQEVLIADRSRPLTVTDRHKRKQETANSYYRGQSQFHKVIELEGNGTEYHLLCTSGSPHGPMFYKKSNWDEDKENRVGESPVYSGGERVEEIEVVE